MNKKVILVLIPIILVVGAFIFFANRNTPFNSGEKTSPLPSQTIVLSPTPVKTAISYTKETFSLSKESIEKLPLIFPRQFILGVKPEVLKAEIVKQDPSGKIEIKVTVQDKGANFQDLIKEYDNYANNAGWTVVDRKAESNQYYLELKRNTPTVIINITSSDDGLLTTINYKTTIGR